MSDVVRRNPGTKSQGEMFESGGLMPKPNPVAEAAARRVVLRRYDAMGMSAADTRELLAMLGLLPLTGSESDSPGPRTRRHRPTPARPPQTPSGGNAGVPHGGAT